MPFQSEKQRRYLHANHPEIAKRWERDYANGGISNHFRRKYFSGAYGQGAGDRGGDPHASRAENIASGHVSAGGGTGGGGGPPIILNPPKGPTDAEIAAADEARLQALEDARRQQIYEDTMSRRDEKIKHKKKIEDMGLNEFQKFGTGLKDYYKNLAYQNRVKNQLWGADEYKNLILPGLIDQSEAQIKEWEEEETEETMSPALIERMLEILREGKVPPYKIREEAEKDLRQQPYINERMGTGQGPILEAAHGGGILDINESEEIISDDGNDIELTAYNAEFDDPKDLSTGVKSLFQAKDGGTSRRRYFTGAYGAGGTENQGSPSAGTAGSTGWGGPSPSSDRGPLDDPDRFGPVSKPQTVPSGINIHDWKKDEDAYEIVAGRKLYESSWGVPGLDPRETADNEEDLLTAVYGTTVKGLQEKVAYRDKRYAEALELAERNQKAALNKWGLGQLAKMGVMLVAMLAMKVPLGDAVKALPKTVSISKTDLGKLVKESIPVMKAKKEYITALTTSKQELLGKVDILNPNEMKSEIGTMISNRTNKINELTKTPEDDTKGDGPTLPPLPPQLGGPSTEEMATEYQDDWYGAIKEKQAQEKALKEKIERDRLAREENPIVGTTEMDIIALRNSGGLANLFRVKNQ